MHFGNATFSVWFYHQASITRASFVKTGCSRGRRE